MELAGAIPNDELKFLFFFWKFTHTQKKITGISLRTCTWCKIGHPRGVNKSGQTNPEMQ